MTRQELAAQVAQGRAVIASLLERQAALKEKIEAATADLRSLEAQLNPVSNDAGERRQRAAPISATRPQGFRPGAYLQCLVDGHAFVTSRSMPGHVTCSHCRSRRKA